MVQTTIILHVFCTIVGLAYSQQTTEKWTWQGDTYWYFGKGATWENARKECQLRGGDLVNINSAEENQMIFDKKLPAIFWTGMNDRRTDGIFVGPLGKNVSYTNFDNDEPNNYGGVREDCIQFYVNGGFWNDFECKIPQPYLCEMNRNGYTLVFKGVAGVPGNLADLWESERTSNENVTAAMNLTNTFKGHFKSALVNQWEKLQIMSVKVAMYKDGKEVMTMIFRANGTKMTWFNKANLISSPYTDLKSTPTNFFSIKGDVVLVRQFFINKHYGGCDQDNGWIIVVAKNTCPWENYKVPQFLYSKNKNSVHWEKGVSGEADVFAIFIQIDSGNGQLPGTNGTIVPGGNGCIYNRIKQQAGATWKDECKNECVCLNGKTGDYTCGRCPTWTLPKECTLVAPEGVFIITAGNCCPNPRCPPDPRFG